MAQPRTVEIKIDVAPSRVAVKKLMRDAREVGVVLAQLDVQLAGLEERASELAARGIRLEVEHIS